MQKIVIALHTAAVTAIAVLAVLHSADSLLMYSALLGGINLIGSLTVCLAVSAAAGDGRYNRRKLRSIERIVSIEMLLFTLPLFIMATPFSSDIILIIITNLTFIVLLVSILIADSKYR